MKYGAHKTIVAVTLLVHTKHERLWSRAENAHVNTKDQEITELEGLWSVLVQTVSLIRFYNFSITDPFQIRNLKWILLISPGFTPVVLFVAKIAADLIHNGRPRQDVGLVFLLGFIVLHDDDDPVGRSVRPQTVLPSHHVLFHRAFVGLCVLNRKQDMVSETKS